ncbi:aldolase catalytic domain-containing protein [Marinobacter sp.]|uniref:aldolase catalytic domain-containing protein n=1 Tax=Marinobacter sp. TaxID=50741 RepID=UPI0038502546
MKAIEHLDCTLRDGGYYNAWNFSPELVRDYLEAMGEAKVNTVEIGLRSLKNEGFKGPYAFSTDSFLKTLSLPPNVRIGVMVNASELLGEQPLEDVLAKLFPLSADESPVKLVRVACHIHEVREALPATQWLRQKGYRVGFNLMQISDRSREDIVALARNAQEFAPDVLYFADSLGCMDPEQTSQIIGWLRQEWDGALGIHTHDNMGLALQNTLRALDDGVTWVDSTVTGMGRGPGNARTEELCIELRERLETRSNMIPLMSLIRRHLQPMQRSHGWGTNPYYYLAGKYGIHPTYIQEMLSDSRYDEEDILAVIDHLRREGGKKFSLDTLDAARHFYQGPPSGSWDPAGLMEGRELLLLGSGPGVSQHRQALEAYIRERRPLVMALNTQTSIAADLIDVRVACHPVRLLADCETHVRLPQPLITPASMLPDDVRESLADKELLDYGLSVERDVFQFGEHHCLVPTSLVIAYALAVATSGRARQILMAGFDGYGADDPRSVEMQKLLALYQNHPEALDMMAVTPTRYNIPAKSVYAL